MFLFTLFCLFFTPKAFTQAGLTVGNDEIYKFRGEVQAREFGIENVVINRILSDARSKRMNLLKEAKFLLLNGETELARSSIKKLLLRDQDDLLPTTLRYLALADFQDGNWKAALKTLSKPELSKFPHFAYVCGMKTLVKIALEDLLTLEDEWARCKQENNKDLRGQDIEWMEILVVMASRKNPGLTKDLVKKRSIKNLPLDELRSFLKLALFLNIESKLIEDLETLDYDAIEDEETRAVMAQVYFRQGRFAQAWKLMEDISNPNVENMKGNLWLLRGNQELAYAQFKLALKQKANSHNAVERALPLAWALEQWSDGLKFSERIYVYEKNRMQKLTTTAAFAVKLEKYDDALVNLEQVHREKGEDTALETTQLSTYVALRRNDGDRLAKHAARGCEIGDITNCWLTNALLIWTDFPTLMKREEATIEGEPLHKTLLTQEAVAFKEPVFIDARDIDEMDDALINLVKK